ncbi:hypothetical protein [uncultured Paracoccus sp.]|nr:hypothetical protein [uncultured Paracoccus sp.]
MVTMIAAVLVATIPPVPVGGLVVLALADHAIRQGLVFLLA